MTTTPPPPPPPAPPDEDIDEIVVIGRRPVPPVLDVPPINLPPVIFEPEPPVIVTPPATPPPVVPPVVPPTPPVVNPPVTPPPTPPVTPPATSMFTKGLNPGFIEPTAFYQTSSPVQSQYSWGSHGFQAGPTFNAEQYNAAPGAATPFGLQQMYAPLTAEQINRGIAGEDFRTAPVASARRTVAPGSAVSMPAAPTAPTTPTAPAIMGPVAPAPATVDPYAQVTKTLGPNWYYNRQTAADRGDWDTVSYIDSNVDRIVNPPPVTTMPTAPVPKYELPTNGFYIP